MSEDSNARSEVLSSAKKTLFEAASILGFSSFVDIDPLLTDGKKGNDYDQLKTSAHFPFSHSDSDSGSVGAKLISRVDEGVANRTRGNAQGR